MKVRVHYLVPDRSRGYTFDGPDDAAVGDLFLDGRQVVKVVALGSQYDGLTRDLVTRLRPDEEGRAHG